MDDQTRGAMQPKLSSIDFNHPDGVRPWIKQRYHDIYGTQDDGFIDEHLDLVHGLFEGRFPGLLSMDTAYHDIAHTLQATLCLVELLSNRHLTGDKPYIGPESFKLALAGILFHDIGYLKTTDDTQGTGAKYTHVHEKRSCNYARALLPQRGWSDRELRAIANLISATGPLSDVTRIDFQDDVERLLGQLICTADFIGQMSDPEYPEKLPVLFSEFEENFRYREIPREDWPFKSYEALLRGTPAFWNVFVNRKMTVECDGVWKYLENPLTGENMYLDAVQDNLEIIRRKIETLDQGGQAADSPDAATPFGTSVHR